MNMVAFDTLKLARKLRDAGMPAEQAEAVAEAEAEVLGEFVMAHLATKDDIAELRQEIAEVRSELKQDIAEIRREIIAESRKTILWNVGTMIALVGLLKLFG